MNNIYGSLAHLFERIANLSPEKRKLLELLIEQEQKPKSGVVYDYYNSLSDKGGWLNFEERENKYESNLSKDEIYQLNQENIRDIVAYSEKSVKQGLYEIEWRPLALTEPELTLAKSQKNSPGSWLIFADKGGVSQALAELIKTQGDRCVLVFSGQAYERASGEHYCINPSNSLDFQRLLPEIASNNQPPYRGVVHLWSLDETSAEEYTLNALQNAQVKGCASVLHLVQALALVGRSESPHLWLVTRGAVSVGKVSEPVQVQQAPLWGLGRVIALEHPELQCVSLDLELSGDGEEIQALFKELWFPDREDQVAWRRGVRHIPKLLRHTWKTPVSQPLVDADSSYMITGGLGALGLKLARWLVDQGARHLVLTGRSGASAAAQSVVNQLEQAGAKVLVVNADVSNPEDVTKVLEAVKASLPDLRGIVHAAGVLDDGVLVQLSWERFHRVMAAKVEGAWNLHKLTRDQPLDFFVCFSSITSLLGNAGQGNYAAANAFIDALAHYRRALGLPGLTINWGLWADGGMAASMKSSDQSRMAARGMEAIAPQEGLQILEELLGQNAAQIGVVSANWSKFLAQFPADAYPPLFSDLAQEVRQQVKGQPTQLQTADLMNQLQTATPEKQRELLIAYLQIKVTKILGLDASNPPESHYSLNELGLDSLTSIQLRNWIRTDLKVDLPMKKFIVEASIDQLANALSEQLALASITLAAAPSTEIENEEQEEEEEIIRL